MARMSLFADVVCMSMTPSDNHGRGGEIDPRNAHPSNRQSATDVFGRCERHWFDPALATCDDCHSDMCVECVVAVQGVGTFCAECALDRSGVRSKRRTRSVRRRT